MTVLETAKQIAEIPKWIKPCVWTARMLKALKEGVKGDRWFSLIDKIASKANLEDAAKHVIGNKGCAGIDNITVEQYAKRLESELEKLQTKLLDGTFQPSATKRVYIPKPGSTEQRPLGIPTVSNRVANGAIVNAIEPIFEETFAKHSYGFRPGRGCRRHFEMYLLQPI